MGKNIVTFPGPDGMTLHGYISLPAGRGPFPVMLYNHSSDPEPQFQTDLAEFYNSKGFIFFMPYRHGQGISAEYKGTKYTYIGDAEDKCEAEHADKKFARICKVKLHEHYNRDVVAAVEWLRGPKPLADFTEEKVETRRLMMSGLSYGGVQTILAAEKGLDLRACVAFAPAAQSWGNTELEQRLIDAVGSASVPIFLIQAHNDYNLGPSVTLGGQLKAKALHGSLDRAQVYSGFGSTQKDSSGKITDTDGHGLFALSTGGASIWGADVLEFLNQAIR
jgi:dienelactone hydrolase